MATDFMGRILRDDLPNPSTSPELFDGVLSRRVFAFLIDCVIMGIAIVIVTLVATLLGLFTFGLSLLSLPIIVPLTFVGYYALTLGSPSRATWGMRAMDIVLTPTRSTPLDGWMAMIHVVLFWISTAILTPFVLLLGLLTNRRQLLHDMIVGGLMVRRSPMERHWARYAGRQPSW